MKEKSKVYFTKIITPIKLIEIYKCMNFNLPGKVGVKIHSAEKGNKNFIRPEFLKPLVDYVNGTVLETNISGRTDGKLKRGTNEQHMEVLKENGWIKTFNKVDILDSEGDEKIEIPNGKIIKENYIGTHTKLYDSLLVMVHFKGHQSGGYGGALKQISIGMASRMGKTYIHSAGLNKDPDKLKENKCHPKLFKECMADAALSIMNLYKNKICFITILANISVDCDCDGEARPPCMKDIGIMASLDPVALDKACLDLIYNSNDPGKKELIQRIEELYGQHIIECSVNLGIGNDNYEIINID